MRALAYSFPVVLIEELVPCLVFLSCYKMNKSKTFKLVLFFLNSIYCNLFLSLSPVMKNLFLLLLIFLNL